MGEGDIGVIQARSRPFTTSSYSLHTTQYIHIQPHATLSFLKKNPISKKLLMFLKFMYVKKKLQFVICKFFVHMALDSNYVMYLKISPLHFCHFFFCLFFFGSTDLNDTILGFLCLLHFLFCYLFSILFMLLLLLLPLLPILGKCQHEEDSPTVLLTKKSNKGIIVGGWPAL